MVFFIQRPFHKKTPVLNKEGHLITIKSKLVVVVSAATAQFVLFQRRNDEKAKIPAGRIGDPLTKRHVELSYTPLDTTRGKSTIMVFGLGGGRYAAVQVHQGTKAAYLDPVLKYMKLHPEEASKQLRFVYNLHACEDGNPEKIRKADPADPRYFTFPVFIVLKKDRGEKLEDLQKDIMARLTQFANTHHGHGEGEFKYLPDFCLGSIQNDPPILPWNHFIQNKSVRSFVKRCYPKNSRHDIMANNDVLIRFFGSVEEGIRQLTMSDIEWEKL